MPCTWKAARQLAARAMSENIWMLIAPPKGRAMAEMPRARLRRRLKKLTAAVRGTTPTSMGLAMVRATMYAA